ncbi:MAG: DUF5058 family protein [Peptostreptococcaceae bacterium]|nr:DUF5058 family protein [Peptostreptococcaceae bacterium]
MIFSKHAFQAGKKMGIKKERMKKAVKSSAIIFIGPSIEILSGMLSLWITVGVPMVRKRLSLSCP